MIERFFRSLKEECVWQHNFAGFVEARAAISELDPLVQRASSPSGARLPEPASVPGSATTGGGLRWGEHYILSEQTPLRARTLRLIGVSSGSTSSERRRLASRI